MFKEARPYMFFKNRSEIARYIEQELLTASLGAIERTTNEEERRNIRLRIADIGRYFAEAMQPEAAEGWWTIEQAAAHLNTTPKAMYKWVKEHGCPASRVGPGIRTALRFRRSELDAWLMNQRPTALREPPLPARSTRRRPVTLEQLLK